VARFYGFGESEIMAMSTETFQGYAKAIPIIMARETLAGFAISSYPHMSQENQRKEHRKVFKQAFPASFEKRKPMSLEDLARVIKNGN